MRDFYNTIELEGAVLKESLSDANRQQIKVVKILQNSGKENMTPWEVWKEGFRNSSPITSVRRAMTNLTILGVLEKTEIMRMGDYGKPNYAWKIKGHVPSGVKVGEHGQITFL